MYLNTCLKITGFTENIVEVKKKKHHTQELIISQKL